MKCNCEFDGKKVKNLEVIRVSEKTVRVLYKGKSVKRHIEKHDVEFIKEDE